MNILFVQHVKVDLSDSHMHSKENRNKQKFHSLISSNVKKKWAFSETSISIAEFSSLGAPSDCNEQQNLKFSSFFIHSNLLIDCAMNSGLFKSI